MKHLSFGLIGIHSHRAEVYVDSRITVLDKVRKMITKRSGKL